MSLHRSNPTCYKVSNKQPLVSAVKTTGGCFLLESLFVKIVDETSTVYKL